MDGWKMRTLADTKVWVEEENKLTFGYLERFHWWIRTRLLCCGTTSASRHRNSRAVAIFTSITMGCKIRMCCWWPESLNAEPRILLDPNTLSADGIVVALSGTAISDDGKLLVYGIAASDPIGMWWHVRDVGTGKDLPDSIKWVKFSGVSWTKDGKGFFYSRYDEPKARRCVTRITFRNCTTTKWGLRTGVTSWSLSVR